MNNERLYTLQDLIFVIVIYNCSCLESVAYKTLRDKGVNIIVCDNSTKDYNNKTYVNEDNNIYINMGGNKGLSKAYNAAINKIGDKYKFVILFDDDTKIEENYFESILNNINSYLADIFLPIVISNNIMISPCVLEKNIIKKIDNIDHCDINNISGINSGMIINTEILKNYRYNENIFLDYLDHDFMRDMNKQNKKIKVMNDIILHQNYSVDTDSLEVAYNRLCITKHDLKEFYKNDRLTYFYYITLTKLVMVKKFKSLRFLFVKDFKSNK